MQPGNYIYTVSGEGIHPDASATVVVTEDLAPNAGTDVTTVVCANEPAFSLFSLLGGNPQIGGLWRFNFMATTGIFVPGSDPEGTYTYIVPGIGACSNDSSEVLLIVPNLALDGIDGPADVPEVGTLTFNATPELDDAGSYDWIIPTGWSWDDATPADGVAYLMPPEQAGVYSICVTATDGVCVGNEVCFDTEVTVGVHEEQGSFGLVAFPNPNTGNFTVRSTSVRGDIRVRVLNAMGAQVSSALLTSTQPAIDLSLVSAGSYTLQWEHSEGRGMQRIVVAR
ncbi:MAG: T9SS type A sorting domain-containing protein [Flavobacteriales bacterium]|nr:T9SS type A sorting domain-containing protein [Flavobacteriales bacterium]